MANEKMGLNHQFGVCPHCGTEIAIELGRIKVVTLQEFQKEVKEAVANGN